MQEQTRISISQPPRSGHDYPFLAGGHELATVVLDMLVEHPASAELPLYLVQANNLQLSAAYGGSFVIVIHDRLGNVVVDTTNADYLGHHSWGTYYATHRWETADHRLFHLTLGSASQVGFPEAVTPENLMIDPRTYCPVLTGVQQISVFDRAPSALAVVDFASNVRLRAGYNTQWVVEDVPARTLSGDRIVTPLTLLSVPGQGLGTLDNCGDEESAYIRSLNQQSAGVSGNFLIAGDTCFRLEPVITFDEDGTAIIEQGKLNLFDDCEACCDCDDYLAVYLSIQRTKRKSEPVAATLMEIKDRYIAAKERVESVLECLLTSSLRLQVSRAEECQIAIAAGIMNPGASPLYNTDLEIIVMKWGGSGWVDATLEYVPGIATRLEQTKNIGTVPLTREVNNVIGTNLDCIQPGGTGFVAFRIGLFGNDRLRICVGLPDASPGDYVCREVVNSCTYIPDPAVTTTLMPGTTTTTTTLGPVIGTTTTTLGPVIGTTTTTTLGPITGTTTTTTLGPITGTTTTTTTTTTLGPITGTTTTTTLGPTTTTTTTTTTPPIPTAYTSIMYLLSPQDDTWRTFTDTSVATSPITLDDPFVSAFISIDPVKQLVYTSDGTNNVIVRDFDGNVLTVFENSNSVRQFPLGEKPSINANFAGVRGIAADPTANQVYVVDSLGIYRIDLTLTTDPLPTLTGVPGLVVAHPHIQACDPCLLYGHLVFANRYGVFAYKYGNPPNPLAVSVLDNMVQLTTIPALPLGITVSGITHRYLLDKAGEPNGYELIMALSNGEMLRSESYEYQMTSAMSWQPPFPRMAEDQLLGLSPGVFASQIPGENPVIYVLTRIGSLDAVSAAYNEVLETVGDALDIDNPLQLVPKLTQAATAISGSPNYAKTNFPASPRKPHTHQYNETLPKELDRWRTSREYPFKYLVDPFPDFFASPQAMPGRGQRPLVDFNNDLLNATVRSSGGHVMSYGYFGGISHAVDVTGDEVNRKNFREYEIGVGNNPYTLQPVVIQPSLDIFLNEADPNFSATAISEEENPYVQPRAILQGQNSSASSINNDYEIKTNTHMRVPLMAMFPKAKRGTVGFILPAADSPTVFVEQHNLHKTYTPLHYNRSEFHKIGGVILRQQTYQNTYLAAGNGDLQGAPYPTAAVRSRAVHQYELFTLSRAYATELRSADSLTKIADLVEFGAHNALFYLREGETGLYPIHYLRKSTYYSNFFAISGNTPHSDGIPALHQSITNFWLGGDDAREVFVVATKLDTDPDYIRESIFTGMPTPATPAITYPNMDVYFGQARSFFKRLDDPRHPRPFLFDFYFGPDAPAIWSYEQTQEEIMNSSDQGPAGPIATFLQRYENHDSSLISDRAVVERSGDRIYDLVTSPTGLAVLKTVPAIPPAGLTDEGVRAFTSPGTVIAMWGSEDPLWNGLVIADHHANYVPAATDELAIRVPASRQHFSGLTSQERAPKYYQVAGGVYGKRMVCNANTADQFITEWTGDLRHPIRYEMSLGTEGYDAGSITMLFDGGYTTGYNRQFRGLRFRLDHFEFNTSLDEMTRNVVARGIIELVTVSGVIESSGGHTATVDTTFEPVILGYIDIPTNEAVAGHPLLTSYEMMTRIRLWADFSPTRPAPYKVGYYVVDTGEERSFTVEPSFGGMFGSVGLQYGFMYDSVQGRLFATEISARAKVPENPVMIGDLGQIESAGRHKARYDYEYQIPRDFTSTTTADPLGG